MKTKFSFLRGVATRFLNYNIGPSPAWAWLAAPFIAIGLSACGGGGGDTPAAPTTTTTSAGSGGGSTTFNWAAIPVNSTPNVRISMAGVVPSRSDIGLQVGDDQWKTMLTLGNAKVTKTSLKVEGDPRDVYAVTFVDGITGGDCQKMVYADTGEATGTKGLGDATFNACGGNALQRVQYYWTDITGRLFFKGLDGLCWENFRNTTAKAWGVRSATCAI